MIKVRDFTPFPNWVIKLHAHFELFSYITWNNFIPFDKIG